jgi:hypothetical protein
MLPYIIMVGLLALLAVYGATNRDNSPAVDNTVDVGSVREAHNFDSVPVMVATSDAVVIATVSDVAEGRTIGDPGAELTGTEVTLAVDEVLWGELGREVSLEIDYSPPWAAPGERAVFFLHAKADKTATTYYRPVNISQSVYPTSSANLTSWTTDGFAATVADMDLAGLRGAIQRAAPLIEEGLVKAATPDGPKVSGGD